MRRETYDIRDGHRGVLLHPESDDERRPTPVECQLLFVMLGGRLERPVEQTAFAHVTVVVRDLDGYGAHINFVVPTPGNGLDDWVSQGAWIRVGPKHSKPSALLEVDWRPEPFGTVLLGPDAQGEYSIDLHPMGEHSLSCDECERLLFGPPDAVRALQFDKEET